VVSLSCVVPTARQFAAVQHDTLSTSSCARELPVGFGTVSRCHLVPFHTSLNAGKAVKPVPSCRQLPTRVQAVADGQDTDVEARSKSLPALMAAGVVGNGAGGVR
jgi:hypothetical protein